MRRVFAAAGLLVFCVVVLSLLIAGCGGGGTDPAATTASSLGGSTSTTASATGEKTFTLAELAQFDGKEGRPAYVAVDGVVYDVSGSARWREGQHTSCPLEAMAGKDLTAEMEQAPSNMRSLLQRMTVVGTLVQ